MQDVFQILGTFFCLRGRSKGVRTLSQLLCTHLRVNVVRSFPLLVLVLEGCHLTWLVLITGAEIKDPTKERWAERE